MFDGVNVVQELQVCAGHSHIAPIRISSLRLDLLTHFDLHRGDSTLQHTSLL